MMSQLNNLKVMSSIIEYKDDYGYLLSQAANRVCIVLEQWFSPLFVSSPLGGFPRQLL